MCGRYYFDIEEKELLSIVDAVQENLYGEIKTGEIYPADKATIIILNKEKTIAMPAKWGFPKWDNKGVIINARAEGISEKRMFKNLSKSKRCIIPASAYFEWNDKNKYMFKKDDSIYLAGLYDNFYNGNEQLSLFDNNKEYTAFTIITKQANNCVSAIHNRMPLIFIKEEMKYYLSGENIETLLSENNCDITYSLIN